MQNSSAPTRNGRINPARSGGGSGAVRRALVLLGGLTLGLACIDLTPPPEVAKYRNGVGSTGGDVGANGGTEAGGNANTAGALGTGGATGAGGATSVGGSTGAGGTTSSDAGSGGTNDLGSGGAVGTGGRTSPDGSASTGGASSAGGEIGDVPLGTGGESATGGVLATGGRGGATAATGGVADTGGAIGTGGATAAGGATGTGGASGTGGATGTGGTTGYNCASAIVPTSGAVTDFTDWNATTARWGTGALIGTIYQYASSGATMKTATVEGTPKGLHLSGTVSSTGYAGGGLTFLSCVKVSSFTKIQFEVYGSAANCAVELQLQTFDQRPTDQSPPGGCVKATDGSGCFTFPVTNVTALSSPVAAPGTTVTATLANFTNWSAAAAGQIVGMQWQFIRSGSSDCAVDATFTNIKFVP